MRKPIPIIVGAPRSGTTLLRAMLDSHPDLAITPETYFLVALAKSPRFSLRRSRFNRERFVEELFSHPRFSLWGLAEADVRDELAARSVSSFTEAFGALYQLYANQAGKTRAGDKTPWYVRHIDFLHQLLPEARFIHMIRDGRDVALSRGGGIVEGAIAWRTAVRDGRRSGARIGSSFYTEVRYEDLVRDPPFDLRRLCKFLDIKFDTAMLHYFERAASIRAGFHRSDSPAHERLSEPPSLRRDNWEVRMSPADVAIFETIAGRLLDELGYPLSSHEQAIVARLRTRLIVSSQFTRSLQRRALNRLRS
jgi:hypothetical protein